MTGNWPRRMMAGVWPPRRIKTLRPPASRVLAAVFAAAMMPLAGCHVTVASPARQSPRASAVPSSPAPARGGAGPAGLAAVHDPGQVTGTITGTCRYRDAGQLPDPRCTPGAFDPAVTQANIHRTICVTGYTAKVRPPAEETDRFKYDVAYVAYGTPRSKHTELDHLVSLELGGSNDAANLWPEYPPTPNPKDKVENALHRAVCEGRVSLAAAQRAIARDWMTAEVTLGLK
jgi:hypothetical protein